MNQECKNPQLETFGSMLERLASVIFDTREHVAVADKIHHNTAESVQRLGFMLLPVPQPGGATNGPDKESVAPTSLQRLDALISELAGINHSLRNLNEAADNVRSAVQGQL